VSSTLLRVGTFLKPEEVSGERIDHEVRELLAHQG
jgi:hypothetical protein